MATLSANADKPFKWQSGIPREHPLQIEKLRSTLVTSHTAVETSENLSPIDASPLLLKVVNSPAVAFSCGLSMQRLQPALAALVDEYTIITGRIRKLTKQELSSLPHLKGAPYCIDVSPAGAGVLLCEARANHAIKDINLNQHLAAPFSMTASSVDLPPWYQPLDMSSLLKGDEPLVKLQLTHCKGGGSILAATMPHLLVDSHSSTLLLARLAELYRQVPEDIPASAPAPAAVPAPPQSLATAPAAAAAEAVVQAKGGIKSAAPAGAMAVVTARPAAGVKFQQLRSSREKDQLAAMLKEAPAAPIAATAATGAARAAVPKATVDPCGPWSKALLLPKAGSKVSAAAPATAGCHNTDTLKALSLNLQSVERPSLSSTLYWVGAAVKEGLAAARVFPGAASSLTSRLLHIPAGDLQQLKVLAAACSTGGVAMHRISANDAISALVWLIFCELRGRPLPGTSSSSTTTKSSSSKGLLGLFGCVGANTDKLGADARCAAGGDGFLGLAIDLRQNCPDLKQQLPSNYFGNAAWCLHISSDSSATAGASRPSIDAAAAPRGGGGAFDVCSYAAPLQAAAGAVRGGLTSFRGTAGAGGTLLQLIAEQQAAPTSVLVRNLCQLSVHVDAFITSWQFPVHLIDFGSGPPMSYSCAVRPTPPWQAAVLPSMPGEGGVQLLLTVPSSAAAALRRSPVLQQLVPNASFQT